MVGFMEATTLWCFDDGAIVSGGEERGGDFVIVLHDDVVEGIEKLHRRLMGRKDIVFHVF